MIVKISQSLFLWNRDLKLTPVTNLKGVLEVFNYKFNWNTATVIGVIIDWYKGLLLFEKYCFTKNYWSQSGAVYVNGASTVEKNSYSKGNKLNKDDDRDNSDKACANIFLDRAQAYDGRLKGF